MQRTVAKTSPYIRKETSTKRMMVDVVIALMPVMAFALYQFKFDFLVRILIAGGLAVGAEALSFALMKDKNESLAERFESYTINHFVPPLITAIIFVLTLPPKIPLYVVIIGILFAIFVGKMIFGGLGRNIFNPAGLGRIFVGLSFAGAFSYIGISGDVGPTILGGTFEEMLSNVTFKEMFFGLIPGSVGEVNALAILIGGAYLLIRRSADYRVVVSILLTFTLFVLVAGLAQGYGKDLLFKYLLFHLLSGGLLFGVFFMATDPVTSPYTGPGRLIFGLIIGSLVAIIRMFGSLPEGMVFALLIANTFVPLIDYKRWTNSIYTKRFIIGYSVTILLIALAVFAGNGGFVR